MKILNKKEIEKLLSLTDDDNAVIVDGVVMSLEELGAKEIYTVKELKTILNVLKYSKDLEGKFTAIIDDREKEIYEGYVKIKAIKTSDYEHGHMGFPGEHIDRPPARIKKLAIEAYPSVKFPKKS